MLFSTSLSLVRFGLTLLSDANESCFLGFFATSRRVQEEPVYVTMEYRVFARILYLSYRGVDVLYVVRQPSIRLAATTSKMFRMSLSVVLPSGRASLSRVLSLDNSTKNGRCLNGDGRTGYWIAIVINNF